MNTGIKEQVEREPGVMVAEPMAIGGGGALDGGATVDLVRGEFTEGARMWVRRGWGSRLRDGARFAAVTGWKWLVGAVLCAGIVTGSVFVNVVSGVVLSSIVLGWVLRVTQRSVVKRWHRASGLKAEGMDYKRFAAGDPVTAVMVNWPAWSLGRGEVKKGAGAVRTLGHTLFGSLGANLRVGLSAAFNVFVFTLPGVMLWWFGWYDGWNNSFTKGYEQYFVGITISVVGIVAFIAAMLYVPMAQARQAATGDWRRFYDFRLVWGLVRRHWLACVGLAAMFSVASLPVFVFKVVPGFLQQMLEEDGTYSAMSDPEVLSFFRWYTLGCAAALLPLFLWLRLLAGRIYAGAVVKGVKSGRVGVDELGGFERHVLDRVDLLRAAPPIERHVIVRAAGRTVSLAGRWAAGVLMVAIWFTLVGQVFVGAFLNYQGARSWVNQPMVQLPWLNYIPARLVRDVELEMGGAVGDGAG